MDIDVAAPAKACRCSNHSGIASPPAPGAIADLMAHRVQLVGRRRWHNCRFELLAPDHRNYAGQRAVIVAARSRHDCTPGPLLEPASINARDARLVPIECAANNARAMVQQPKSAGQSLENEMPRSPLLRPTEPASQELPLFHFGLRQLLWFIAGVSTLLAGIVSANGVSAIAFLMAALVLMAHLFSTALGSRLRSDADKSLVWDIDRSLRDNSSSAHGRGSADVSTRPSPWHGRGSTALPWLRPLIFGGVLIGGMAGAVFLSLTIGYRSSAAGIIVAAVSAAVLGGWLMFLGGSFYGIFRHGLRDALAETQKDEARQRAPR